MFMEQCTTRSQHRQAVPLYTTADDFYAMQHNARITAECRLCGRMRAAQTEPPARPSGARVNSARARGGTGPGGRSFARDFGVSRGSWGPVFFQSKRSARDFGVSRGPVLSICVYVLFMCLFVWPHICLCLSMLCLFVVSFCFLCGIIVIVCYCLWFACLLYVGWGPRWVSPVSGERRRSRRLLMA